MTKRILLLGWAICLSLNINFLAAEPTGIKTASPELPEITCELPGPSVVMIIGATQHTLTASWPHVTNAARYKITAKDLNTNIIVYSAIMVANPATPPHHVITGLNLDTPYEVGVSASECLFGENFGTPTLAYGQTDSIIVGDLVFGNTCSPIPNSKNPFALGNTQTFSMPIDPNGQNGQYSQTCLVVNGTKTNPSPNLFWRIQLNIAAAECAPDRIKWIYKKSNMQNISLVQEVQNSGQLKVFCSGVLVLTISDIHADNGTMFYTATVTNSIGVGGSFRDPETGCGNTELSANPCGGGLQGKNAGPGNNGEVQIELESRSSFDNELPTEESITAIPNPFNDFTNVQYQVSKQSPVSMVLFNAMGQAQRELLNDTNVEPGTYTLPVDMADLAPGVYFLTIQTESGRKITTVVKQ